MCDVISFFVIRGLEEFLWDFQERLTYNNKSHKKQDFILTLKSAFLEKTQGKGDGARGEGWSNWPPAILG